MPTGFVPANDEGRSFELRLPGESLTTTAFPFALGGTGAVIFRDNIVQCPSVLVETGLNLEAQPGNLAGPLTQAMQELIDLDPDAFWDPPSPAMKYR